MSKSRLFQNFSIPFNPWVYFFIFLTTNTLLSYTSWSLELKIIVGFFGLLLPFGIALARLPISHQIQLSYRREFLPAVPLWVWFFGGVGALFVRFYHLTTLSAWPHYDEGLWGFFALKVFQGWGWHFFYAGNPYPSAYIWILGLWFHWLKPSLLTLWLLPALFSILTIGTGYLAARNFFSKSISFVFAFLLAFTFWPLFLARYNSQQEPMLLWECFLLYLLGFFFRTGTKDNRKGVAVLLGLTTGIGFYFYISWAAIAFVTGLTLLARKDPKGSRFSPFWVFIFSAFTVVVPLLFNGLIQGYIHYFRTIGAFSNNMSVSDQIEVSLSYLGVLFWGMNGHYHTYQPLFGGFLNPILDALFLLGIIEMVQRRSIPLYRWLIIAFFVLILPPMLTQAREPFRLIPLMPVLFIVCSLGWQRLSSPLPASKTAWLALLLALPIASLDFYHLAGPYHQLWSLNENWRGYAKSIINCRAYPILEALSRSQGPGLIYSNFKPGLCDQTLSVVDNSFNAAENPTLSFQSAQWAAVLANINYKPFLERRFPHGEAHVITDTVGPDGVYMLWTMPLTPESRKTLENWQAAAQGFCCMPGRADKNVLKDLEGAYSLFQTDPFLKSCYWEKMADLLLRVGRFKDFTGPVEALRKASAEGYPAAHLFFRQGTFSLIDHKPREAQEAFQKAMGAPLNQTSASEYLLEISLDKNRKEE
ncbi:MAG TPA: hypothetical protein VIJ93_05735 [bacterium]